MKRAEKEASLLTARKKLTTSSESNKTFMRAYVLLLCDLCGEDWLKINFRAPNFTPSNYEEKILYAEFLHWKEVKKNSPFWDSVRASTDRYLSKKRKFIRR